MQKYHILLISLILLASLANAEIVLIKPLEYNLKSGDIIELGSVSPGETIQVITSNTSGSSEGNWYKAVVESLPKGWTALHSNEGARTLVSEIMVPRNTPPGKYNFVIYLSGGNLEPEFFKARVNVKRNLISASISDLKQTGLVDKNLKFKLTLINDSIGAHEVLVDSSLPRTWFQSQKILLDNKETKEVLLEVTPRHHGVKQFKFSIYSQLSGKVIDSFDSQLVVKPTLREKYASANYGLPFFSFSLYPFYLVNSFFSFLFIQ